VLEKLLTDKALKFNEILNEVLKALSSEISEGLAHAISMALANGTLPNCYKELITVALRKEGKKDYSLPSSYRPIALENTLAKIVEKLLTTRLSRAAEEHALLSWTQMGARKERLIMSAIGLLTSCVQTTWRARPGSVVLMLSLNLAGAFDNVPHDKLLEILRRKGLSEWIIRVIACFTQGRRTRIAYTGFESD
jgi:Reverse transcriptase (RNA-dependent DNA polymerase)